MADQLLSGGNDETPTALVSSPSAAHADGNNSEVGSALPAVVTTSTTSVYDEVDYHSETETEKPVILELGAVSVNSPYSGGVTGISVNDSPASALPGTSYPLDMHLTHPHSYLASPQAYVANADEHVAHVLPLLVPTASHNHSHGHLPLYNNPYSHHTATNIVSIHGGTLHGNDYGTHLPQTVCTWPASDATDVERKSTPDIVPPPMYISYTGAREHIIAKEANPSWKEKALQIEKDYKKTACDRERTRMRDMNRAFDLLRSKLPVSKPNGKKYSKIESLRIAINYINHLQQCLKDCPTQDMEISNLPLNNKTAQQNTVVDYVLEIEDARQREQSYHYENRKGNYKDIDKELDESHSGTWSENSYVQNGQNQWD